jgi:hypothetical protein
MDLSFAAGTVGMKLNLVGNSDHADMLIGKQTIMPSQQC